MNFGFWKNFWAQIIADYVYFHMAYHTFIWNHVGWHRRVLNMTHFQLFAWFGKFLLVKKIFKKSKLLPVHTIAPKTSSQWSSNPEFLLEAFFRSLLRLKPAYWFECIVVPTISPNKIYMDMKDVCTELEDLETINVWFNKNYFTTIYG